MNWNEVHDCQEVNLNTLLNLDISVTTHRRQKLTLLHLSTDMFHKETFLTLRKNCKVKPLPSAFIKL